MAAQGNIQHTPVVGDVLEYLLVCTANNQTSINVLHYKVTAVNAGGAGLGTIVTHLDAAFHTVLKDLMPVVAAYAGSLIKGIIIPPVTDPALIKDNAAVGNVAGELLPTQTCGIITKRTGSGGRARRGRFYIPFPGEGSNTNAQSPNAGYLANAATLAGLLDDQQTANAGGGATTTLQPVLLHRASSTTHNITSAEVRTKWATQRRRGPAGQPNVSPL